MVLLCIEYKLITVPYFLDEIKPYELQILMDNLNVSVKNDWIIAREIMWSNLSPWSKKKLKPSDIMHLPWDDDYNDHQNIEVNAELVEKMRKQAESRQAALVAAGVL